MHETTLRKGAGGQWLGQWSRWSAIDKGWFPLNKQTFQHVHLTCTRLMKIKITWQTGRVAVFRTPEQNVHSCHFLFARLGLFFFLLKGDSSRHSCPCTQINGCLFSQLTERETYKHLPFWSLLWDKIPLILLWCFHSSKTGQWPGCFSFYLLWVTAFTAPSTATQLQELEEK